MWIFCKDGFFSAVEHRSDDSKVMVRARLKRDITRLAKRFKAKVIELPNRDYAYRIVIDKTDWATYAANTAAEIDYDNFKNAVHDGTARDHAYMRVWSAMYQLQLEA